MSNKSKDFEYIKNKFDNDGVRAPESLSEENMLGMLETADKKDRIVSFLSADEKAVEIVTADPRKDVSRRTLVKRIISAAAVLLVAAFGIYGIHTAIVTPPDTSVTGGELYTFRSTGEIKRTIRSIDASSHGMISIKSNDYSEDSGYVSDAGIEGDSAVFEESYSAQGSAGQISDAAHSSTYLQVDDVDEADIVKTDGKYIYYVNTKKEVVILEARNGKTKKLSVIGSSGVENYIEDIYLKDDTLVTVGRFYEDGEDEGSSGIVIYDISDRSRPEMISYFRQSGDIVSSRMVGSYVYLVTEDRVYRGGRCVPMCGSGDSYTGLSPSDICCVPEPAASSYAVLSAVDITSGEQSRSRTKAVFGATDEIYCNDHALYCISREWGKKNGKTYTRIARASLDGLEVKFNGTARVSGYVNDRFSMDERDGYFRIATTSQRSGMDVNYLYVLDPDLKNAGKVSGFARNESIKAVRYIGSKAYVITYEAIDPLFIIDLSDPEDPKIEGEVKIDGFSTLLVPTGEGRLLGIGHATGDNGYGGEYDSGLKLVLFDISDPSEPKVMDSKEFKDMESPAQSDSHALMINSEGSYYAIPYEVTRYNEDAAVIEDEDDGEYIEKDPEYETGVLAFSTEGSIKVISQHRLGSEYISRCVYIGNYIYALEEDGSCHGFLL